MLEDEFGDLVAKARNGLGIVVAVVAGLLVWGLMSAGMFLRGRIRAN